MNMDISLFNLVIAVCGFLAVFVFKTVFAKLDSHEQQHKVLEKEFRGYLMTLPDKYVQRDVYRADIQELKEDLKRLVASLERKKDKHE